MAPDTPMPLWNTAKYKLPSLFSILVILISIFGAIITTVPRIFDSDNNLESIRSVNVSLCKPENYRARKCSEWKYTENSHDALVLLTQAMHLIANNSNLTFVSAPHVSYSLCIIVDTNGTVYINPKLINASSETRYKLLNERSILCTNEDTGITQRRFLEINVHAFDIHHQPFEVQFQDSYAFQMQHALFLLSGQTPCNNKKIN